MNKAHINGFEMSYELRGQGEPLSLLRGMTGAGTNWDMVFPTAIEGFQTIIPDLRGYGRSNHPAGQFSIRQCAADVVALADELQIETFKAIGLSLGGNAMLHIAAEATHRVVAMAVKHVGGDIQIEELRRYAKELSERHDDMDGPSFLAHAPSFAKTSVEFLRA